MKKLFFIFSLLFTTLFFSCNLNDNYYVFVRMNENKDLIGYKASSSSNAHYETKVNTTFTGIYELIPSSNRDIEIEYVISSDPNIIEITKIDTNNNTFYAIAKNKGRATIKVQTTHYYSNTSNPIYVK